MPSDHVYAIDHLLKLLPIWHLSIV